MSRNGRWFSDRTVAWRGAAIGMLVLQAGCGSVDDSREAAAAARLKELGVLVVMDGAREHVASLNFAAVRDEEKRAEAFLLLKDLPYLAALDISRTQPSPEHLKSLAAAKQLKSLTASKVPLNDEDLAVLAGLSRLESMQLAETEITGAGLKALSKCRALKVLNLSGSQVSGGLEPLAGLPDLDWLLLNDVTIEDDSLAALGEASGLSRLGLTGSEYPAESLERLMKSKPGLRVDRDVAGQAETPGYDDAPVQSEP